MEGDVTKNSADERFNSPDEETIRKLMALMAVMRELRDLSPSFPASYALALLSVALRPGAGPTEYMKDLETIQPIMSRIMVALGPKSRSGDAGFELVDTLTDVVDMRRKRTFLTAKGKAVIGRLLKAMERYHEAQS